MLIADRNGMVVRKPIPYDAEVAWIESTGTQWIDTGVHATQNTTAKIKCAWMTSTNDTAVFGADNGNTWTGFILQQNTGIRFVKGGPTNTFAQRWGRFAAGTMYDIECSQNGVVIDGTLYSFNGTPTSEFYVNKPISLFGWWRNTQPWGSNVKIAYVQFFENGSLVRDFIPVRFTNELGVSEGAMYDRVSKKLFRNQGTGSFTIGPDKKTTSDYVQDGLVIMWDGIENAGPGVHSDSTLDFKDLVTGSSCGVGYEYGWSTNIPETPLFTIERDGVRSNDAVINRSVGIGIPYPVSGYTWNYTIEYVRRVHSFATTAGYNPSVVNSYPSQTSTGMLMCQTGNHHIYLLYGGFTDTGLIESLGGCSVTSWGDNTDGREVIVHGVGSFTCGRGQFGVNTNTHICLSSSSCDATLCHLRVYSRALTAAEIAANRAVDEIRFYLPSTS